MFAYDMIILLLTVIRSYKTRSIVNFLFFHTDKIKYFTEIAEQMNSDNFLIILQTVK